MTATRSPDAASTRSDAALRGWDRRVRRCVAWVVVGRLGAPTATRDATREPATEARRRVRAGGVRAPAMDALIDIAYAENGIFGGMDVRSGVSQHIPPTFLAFSSAAGRVNRFYV